MTQQEQQQQEEARRVPRPLEPGTYQTRNGRLVEIYDAAGTGKLLALQPGQDETLNTWNPDSGAYAAGMLGVPHVFDLVYRIAVA